MEAIQDDAREIGMMTRKTKDRIGSWNRWGARIDLCICILIPFFFDIGLMKFIEKYVLQEHVPVAKLLEVFGFVMVSLKKGCI
jgi:hypothetical protein